MSEGRQDRPQHIALNRYDLKGQLARLRGDAPLAQYGRDSLTLVRDSSFTLLLVALKAGTGLPNHTAPGPISVLVLDGRVAFTSKGERCDLGPHELVTLPARIPHEVMALEDSAILITIADPVTHTDPVGLESEREVKAEESSQES
ncbi:cupin domain-containing protein [Deinococcus detaillensis]|uniref:Cupin domain-containing protein n=1 Tax=Deinococcus detaillensis TaxID=2592048 RepID=A0A553UZ96_9DEIO|nr:cupin domain-containing protein [Deinococcus detaillensis]TSA85500.1 cupin domain-containing protein [Deinococcus detaillensis]